MMARFVKFWAEGHGELLMNPGSVVCVYNDSGIKDRSDTPAVKIRCVDLSVWSVTGTVPEVLAKLSDNNANAVAKHDAESLAEFTKSILQYRDRIGELEAELAAVKAKAADDITGWWAENVTGRAIYVIGQDSNGSLVYQMEERLILRSHSDVIKRHYFRDPNRKGWEE